MSNLESNTNNLLVPGLFVRGDDITRKEAQVMYDAGQGENVIETVNDTFFEKKWLDGRSTLVMNNIAAESGASTATTATSGSTSSDSTAEITTGSTTDEANLELAPEVEKLEALAGQLETAADDLKAEHDNAAVDAFESAAGKVARAAEEVRENPTDESAIEEFETATDELKNAAHALEGEIGDGQYQEIVSAVDGFETATDHMLAADDGEADMAGAVAKASDALETLLSATTGLPAEGDVEAVDPYKDLDALSDQLNALTSGLMDKFGVDELAAYEEATEQLEETIDAFNADPTSEASIEGLEQASDGLKTATAGLEGKIDDSIYQNVSAAVNAFETAVDKLAGLDGQQAEVDKVALEMAQALKNVVEATSEGIEGGSNATTATETTTDTSVTTDTSTEIEVPAPVPVPGVVATTPLSNLEKATDDLKAFSEDLGAIFDTTDLDDFEAATVKLEAAGDNLLADPSQENIDAFEVASDELKSVTHALEGKIDDSLYQQVTSAVDGFEHAVDLAVVANSDGDTEDMNIQIALATASLQSLMDLVKDAVDSKQNEAQAA